MPPFWQSSNYSPAFEMPFDCMFVQCRSAWLYILHFQTISIHFWLLYQLLSLPCLFCTLCLLNIPKIVWRQLISKTLRVLSSSLLSVQVSMLYVRIGMMRHLDNLTFIWILISMWSQICFLRWTNAWEARAECLWMFILLSRMVLWEIQIFCSFQSLCYLTTVDFVYMTCSSTFEHLFWCPVSFMHCSTH